MSNKGDRLAQSSREHYYRMQKMGYKKYGLFLKSATVDKIDNLALTMGIPKYQLIDIILEKYVENHETGQSDVNQ